MKTKEWHKRQSRDLYVKKATELGFQTTFCGIYGCGKLPENRKKFFI